MGVRKEEPTPEQYRQPRPLVTKIFVDPETGKLYVVRDAGRWIEAMTEQESTNRFPPMSSPLGELPLISRRRSDHSLPIRRPGDWEESN